MRDMQFIFIALVSFVSAIVFAQSQTSEPTPVTVEAQVPPPEDFVESDYYTPNASPTPTPSPTAKKHLKKPATEVKK